MILFFSRYEKAIKKRKESAQGALEVNRNLAEFVAMDAVHQYVMASGKDVTTFPLPMLEHIYGQKLSELLQTPYAPHSTRFKAKVEGAHVGVTAMQKATGHYVAVKEAALRDIVTDSEWLDLLRRVVIPVREEIIEAQKIPLSDISELNTESQRKLPKLSMLMSLICFDSPMYDNLPLVLSTICETICFNTKQFSRPCRLSTASSDLRHTRESEGPINNYITVKLYSAVRSKTLTQIMFSFGITLSYTRTLTFYEELSQSLKDLYRKSGNRLLPTSLKIGLFSVFSDDNIDKNASSATSIMNFHGTSVSIFQFPDGDCGDLRFRRPYTDLSDEEKKEHHCPALSEFMTVKEIQIASKVLCPTSSNLFTKDDEKRLKAEFEKGMQEENMWLGSVCQGLKPNPPGNQDVRALSWAAYHENKKRDQGSNNKTTIVILPVLTDASHTNEVQYHLMKIAVSYTKYLNPSQTAVGSSDLPLYALKKNIQCARPSEFPQDVYFCFLGPLHIEHAALQCLGQLIKGTGLEDIITAASLDISGLSTSVVDVNSIKKSRYCLQIISVVLYDQLEQANFAGTVIKESPSYIYFFNLLRCIKTLFCFVRSIREANFTLFLSSLEQIAPLFFMLDHTHYSRWLPVFIADLNNLKYSNPDLFDNFMKGYFTVNTGGRPFSKIGFDHSHEHCNKRIKQEYTDLLNQKDRRFLEKLQLCLPQVNEYLSITDEKFSIADEETAEVRKEMTESFIKRYVSDVRQVKRKLQFNPFANDKFQKLSSSFVFLERIVTETGKMFDEGKAQYNEYVQKRLYAGNEDVQNSPIKKNNYKLPSHGNILRKESPQIKLTNKQIMKLRHACHYRPEEARSLFTTEFTGIVLVCGISIITVV